MDTDTNAPFNKAKTREGSISQGVEMTLAEQLGTLNHNERFNKFGRAINVRTETLRGVPQVESDGPEVSSFDTTDTARLGLERNLERHHINLIALAGAIGEFKSSSKLKPRCLNLTALQVLDSSSLPARAFSVALYRSWSPIPSLAH
jgi:hypothetical protein